MKFRDPKTGEVFLRERAFRIYCDEKRGGNIYCPTCPICSKNNGTGESCKSFFESHPAEAARLAGYEVMEDKEDDMDKQDKPLSEWTLGEAQAFCEKRGNGTGCCGGCPLSNADEVCRVDGLPEDWNLEEVPRLTDAEREQCRVFGAKWVSRYDENSVAVLWESKPHLTADGYEGAQVAAKAFGERFPGVKPGDCIAAENI